MAFTWKRYSAAIKMLLNTRQQWHYIRTLKIKCQFAMLTLQIMCLSRSKLKREIDLGYKCLLDTCPLAFYFKTHIEML